MGENEQGGMLRTVVVVGLVVIISMIIMLGVIGLSDNMKSTTNSTSDRIQKGIKNFNGVVDDYDTSNHYYTLDDVNRTAVIGGTKPGKDKDKGSVVVPSYVTQSGVKYTVVDIKSYAYYNSPELTDVDIPDTIKSIGVNSFGYNPKLTKVTFGKGIQTIGNTAFQGAALSSVMVPDSVTTIGDRAFSENPNNKDGFVSIGKNTSYNKDGEHASFGYHYVNGNWVAYTPTIRS